MNPLAKDLLEFSISKDVRFLFKFLLKELDLLERECGLENSQKAFYRGRILRSGNDVLRNLATELQKYDISFKTNDPSPESDNQPNP